MTRPNFGFGLHGEQSRVARAHIKAQISRFGGHPLLAPVGYYFGYHFSAVLVPETPRDAYHLTTTVMSTGHRCCLAPTRYNDTISVYVRKAAAFDSHSLCHL